jgi:S1-C subfamily serine protease
VTASDDHTSEKRRRSAAASALEVGDVIVAVDGKDVTGANKYLYESLTHVRVGDEVSFSVEDGGTVTLVAGTPP